MSLGPVTGSGKDSCDFYGHSCPWAAEVTGAAIGENEANPEGGRAKNVQKKQNLHFTVESLDPAIPEGRQLGLCHCNQTSGTRTDPRASLAPSYRICTPPPPAANGHSLPSSVQQPVPPEGCLAFPALLPHLIQGSHAPSCRSVVCPRPARTELRGGLVTQLCRHGQLPRGAHTSSAHSPGLRDLLGTFTRGTLAKCQGALGDTGQCPISTAPAQCPTAPTAPAQGWGVAPAGWHLPAL